MSRALSAFGLALAVLVAIPAHAQSPQEIPLGIETPPAEPELEPEPAPDPPAPATTPPASPTLDDVVRGLDQTGTPPLPAREGELPPPSAPPGEPRPVPNYDGREPVPTDAADVAIWIPRVLFFPLHLFFEYAVRWPLLHLAAWMERGAVVERLREWATWDEGRAGVFPRFLVDFGFRPHVGVSFFWEQLGSADNVDVRGDFTAWDDLLAARAAVTTRVFRDNSGELTVRGGYVQRPDNIYLGPEPDDVCFLVNGCRYWSAIGEAQIMFRFLLPELNRLWTAVAYRNARFSNDTDDRPRIPLYVAEGLPGFIEGYDLVSVQAGAELDSRSPDIHFEPGSGVRLELLGSFSVDPTDTDLRFFRYGGELSGYWDLGHRHVLSAAFYTELIGNVSEASTPGGARRPVPFSEQVVLGGNEHMRGFLWGRLRGDHAYEATLQYRWPVWWLLDASVFVSVGTALPSFSEWDIVKNYLNYGLAMRAPLSRDVSLDLIAALGTNRWDSEDLDPIHSGRLALGINYGF